VATPTPAGSPPFVVFETNVNRLVALASTPSASTNQILQRLQKQSEKSHAALANVGETVQAAKDRGEPIAEHLKPLMAEISSMGEIVDDYVKLVKTRQFLGAWMVVMLVTFAEAYLEDALGLILSHRMQPASLPPSISTDMMKKWIKNLLRAGSPHAWIKQLEAFGATGYDADLADKMRAIWDRRHKIAHTAEPGINAGASQQLVDAAFVVAAFVKVTDTFVVACTGVTAPTSP
jgi:hypothetical protein